MSEINYTITSTNPNEYSIIRQSLQALTTELREFMRTGLTTMCSFVLLDFADYIEFEFFDTNSVTIINLEQLILIILELMILLIYKQNLTIDL